MNVPTLRIAGAWSSPYRLGEPMFIYDGWIHVGTFERVVVTHGGRVVQLESLAVAAVVRQQTRKLRKLALLEAIAFLVDNFPSVTTVCLSLRSHVDGHEDGRQLAGIRAELLRRIRADEIHIAPDFEPPLRGHFVVSGAWKRSQRNLDALLAARRVEREAYRAHKVAAQTARGRLLSYGARIRGLLSGTGA